MTLFLSILLILSIAVLFARLASLLSVPYPAFLALGGAILAFLPDAPSIALDPGLALVIFVAPALLGAAYETSLRDLRDYRLSIITMVVFVVAVSTAAVAIVFRQFVPDIPWAAAVALGAILAPPDAGAASAVLRGMKLPNRVRTVLEGESLFNDATALLIFAVALRVVRDGDASLGSLIAGYTASIAGSIALGVALARLVPFLLRLAGDAPSSIVLQFSATFGVWLLAEALQFSPILTVVSYGIALAHPSHQFGAPLLRAKSAAVWETVVFLTNVLAFTLIGMQLAPLLAQLNPQQRTHYFTVAAAIFVTVVIIRFVSVMSYNCILRMIMKQFAKMAPTRVRPPTVGSGVIISWAGMRGIVSLAAALALPRYFPERHLIQFVSFTVILGTLVVQGFTLGPLIRLLQFPEDRQLERELALARRKVLQASIGALDGDISAPAEALRHEYQSILELDDAAKPGAFFKLTETERLRLKMNRAARDALQKLRAEGQISDTAYRRIDAALDRAYLYATRYTLAE